MNINDPSLWPADLDVLRLELDDDPEPGGEVGALIADGVLVATLHHHDIGGPPDVVDRSDAVELRDQRFWELRIVAADGTRKEARVFVGVSPTERGHPPRGVVAWATMALLWHLKAGVARQG